MTAHGLITEQPIVASGGSPSVARVARGVSVSEMTADDLEPLIALGAAMHKESRYKNKNYSAEKVRMMGRKWLASPKTCFCAVARRNGVRVGFFVGLIAEFFFGRDRASYDVLLYVEPSSRGTIAASLLTDAYKAWARGQGIPDDAIYVGVSAQIDNTKTFSFYEKHGFRERGRTFSLEVAHV